MSFSGNIADVGFFKIHPAIGVARLADTNEYYEFFDYAAKREAGQGDQLKYKVKTPDGQHWWKKQAVQFRIFAYDSDGIGLGEVTSSYLEDNNIRATWTSKVANRKIFHRGGQPILSAEGKASGGEQSDLVATNPFSWREGPQDDISLGTITGRGLFIPPAGGVYRENSDKRILNYSGNFNRYFGVTDTTSDGTISVEFHGDGIEDKAVVAACVVVAPQDQAPDLTPRMINSGKVLDWVTQTKKDLGFPGQSRVNHNEHEKLAFGMDDKMWATMNGDYSPGLEVNLSYNGFSQEEPIKNPVAAFYETQNEGGIVFQGNRIVSQYEIRVKYDDGLLPSQVQHGMLTSGLCSTWQTDMTACVGYWSATFPSMVLYKDEEDQYPTYRRYADDPNSDFSQAEDYSKYKDLMGVARGTDPDELKETERYNENAGPSPTAPFFVKPEDH